MRLHGNMNKDAGAGDNEQCFLKLTRNIRIDTLVCVLLKKADNPEGIRYKRSESNTNGDQTRSEAKQRAMDNRQ